MAEVAGPSCAIVMGTPKMKNENTEICEPEPKRAKLEVIVTESIFKLEERLNGILCCAVCLDLPNVAVYQCANGHLMCIGCFSHLLADARLKDETATCPNCRCDISKTSCSRNLAVEKAISELPASCQYCSEQLPRSTLKHHETQLCQERNVPCKYERIGCPWRGPFHERQAHESTCAHPRKSGDDIMEALQVIDVERQAEMRLFQNIFSLLSFEKIAFSDLQLRPYRSDDFITKLFYESSRFSAFNMQWVVKASVCDDVKNPSQTLNRTLNYQLILKSKLANPLSLHYTALRGPYGEAKVDPVIYRAEFSQDNQQANAQLLPFTDMAECNKVLAARTINIRLILFQVSK